MSTDQQLNESRFGHSWCRSLHRRWSLAAVIGLGTPMLASGAETGAADTPPNALQASYDIVIAGAGTGGIGAAIQAARMGRSVLLLEETDWIGGQALAAAVTAMDEGGAGNLVRERGLYRELVQRAQEYYLPLGKNPFRVAAMTNTRFEPKVGRLLVYDLFVAARRTGRLDLSLRSRVTKVQRNGDTVTGVAVDIGTPDKTIQRVIASKVLIDATEWGDVLPLTGARYRAGNRISGNLDLERRIQDNTWTAVIRRYPAGVPAPLRISQPPPGYATMQPVFAKAIVEGDAPRQRTGPMSWKAFVDYRGMPDSTTKGDSSQLTRTHLNYTNDYPCTVAYLEDPARRIAGDRAMRLRTLQLLHYVQNVLGHTDWSVADDEGFDSPYNRQEIDAWITAQPEMAPYRAILYHFSTLPYVRESRRLVGMHTLRAAEISRGPGRTPTQFANTVCLGDYRLDLHGGRSAADLELDLDRLVDLEDAQPGRAGPFAIPCETLIPETIDGLLAAEKNFSQTRLVSGATRMQPHTLNLGQAAGALAALAVSQGVPPRRIDPVLVQRVLLAAGSTLAIAPLHDVAPRSPDWPAIQLAIVRGFLPLENRRFEPTRSLTKRELTVALGLWAGRPSNVTGDASPVTRADFANALETLPGSNVRVHFSATAEAAAQPITRSEAAQVNAEFLELRAIGQLRAMPQTLTWDSVKPASAPVAQSDTPGMSSYLRRLLEAKVIANADYWAANAVAGKECDGARVAELLWQGARLFEPAATKESAIDVLLLRRIISARDYWAKSAVPGARCAGRNVATVIRNLADHLPPGGASARVAKPD